MFLPPAGCEQLDSKTADTPSTASQCQSDEAWSKQK